MFSVMVIVFLYFFLTGAFVLGVTGSSVKICLFGGLILGLVLPVLVATRYILNPTLNLY